jgi:prolyl 4-hydroxylase
MSLDGRLQDALRRLAVGGSDDVAAATQLIWKAAGEGSAEAWRWLATLTAAGVGVPQDWERALDHLATAAIGGSESARRQLLSLAAVPEKGTVRDWSALRGSVRLEPWFGRGEKTVLNISPRVVTVRRFLPLAVCDWLLERTRGPLSESLLLTGDPPVPDAEYRSHSAQAFNFVDCDVVVLLTRARIVANIGVPPGALEVSQILHYATGETFGLHWDYLRPDVPRQAAEIAANGQRIITFLIYLNAGYEGGETALPQLDLRFRGEPGDALYWANVDPTGSPDPRTQHAGLPPTVGEKWVFSQGVRSLARV